VTPGPTGWLLPAPFDAAPLDDDLEPPPPSARRRRVTASQLALAGAGLAEQDRSILGSLLDLRYLTTRQIDRLHIQADPNLSRLASARRTQRHMARLDALGLVDKLDRRIGGSRAGSAAYIWRLRPAGLRLLGADPRRATHGFAHLAHALDVAEVVVRLRENERVHDELEVAAIETEPACWRYYTSANGTKRTVRPDLRATLRVVGGELHWFIEVDRGTEHRRFLARKITGYLALWRGGGEHARAGVFPRVLWVVPNRYRAEELRHLLATTPGLPPGMMTLTLRDDAVAALTELPE